MHDNSVKHERVGFGKSRVIVEDVRKLLQASVNSAFYHDGENYTVSARFIRLVGDDRATIYIRNDQGDEYYGTVESAQSAFDHATELDIFINDDNYQFVWEKQVFAHDHPTEVTSHSIPPLTPEDGIENDLALFASKCSRITVDNEDDYVLYRALYSLPDGQSTFVVKTISDKTYTHSGPTSALEARVVPGDFYTYQPHNDLLWQVHGIQLSPLGFIRPVASPVYLV
ncbi:hypothetical protein [Pseudomonas sp. NY15354]|uniref:hypothetical protein n=1 Tax=Pseudomonas sp. NY15354 TaxID=3400351 RepID=UPI003A84A2B3